MNISVSWTMTIKFKIKHPPMPIGTRGKLCWVDFQFQISYCKWNKDWKTIYKRLKQ